jgi:hypothetical protein
VNIGALGGSTITAFGLTTALGAAITGASL